MANRYQYNISYEKGEPYQTLDSSECWENTNEKGIKSKEKYSTDMIHHILVEVESVIRDTKNELAVELFDSHDFDMDVLRMWLSEYNPIFHRIK